MCLKGEEWRRPGGHPGERVGGREQHALPRQERHAQSRGGRQDQEGAQVWVLNSILMANNDLSNYTCNCVFCSPVVDLPVGEEGVDERVGAVLTTHVQDVTVVHF